MSDYFEGLKLAQRIGVPCKDCATASIWCGPCAAKWHRACEDQKRAERSALQPPSTPDSTEARA